MEVSLLKYRLAKELGQESRHMLDDMLDVSAPDDQRSPPPPPLSTSIPRVLLGGDAHCPAVISLAGICLGHEQGSTLRFSILQFLVLDLAMAIKMCCYSESETVLIVPPHPPLKHVGTNFPAIHSLVDMWDFHRTGGFCRQCKLCALPAQQIWLQIRQRCPYAPLLSVTPACCC